MDEFEDANVKAVFDGFAPAVRKDALWLRGLIFDTAAGLGGEAGGGAGAGAGAGEIIETLKWGQPAYLPKRPRVGTTIRIGALGGVGAAGGAGGEGQFAMFVHCQTTLIETYRERYGGDLVLQGNRAVVFTAGQRVAEDVLRHCIGLALTYHLTGKAARAAGVT